MTNKSLSPAAQAVMNAFLGDAEDTGLQMDDLRENVAAALRAVANDWQIDTEFIEGVEYIRTTTLDSIAAELENN